jgi:hypothetical protein
MTFVLLAALVVFVVCRLGLRKVNLPATKAILPEETCQRHERTFQTYEAVGIVVAIIALLAIIVS